MYYEFNEAARYIGDRLVPKYHQHLTGLKIAYLFKGDPGAEPKPRKALRDGKKFVWAKAAKADSGKMTCGCSRKLRCHCSTN